jgi:O-methyltransferase
MIRKYTYNRIHTLATYCPWQDEPLFMDAYDRLVGYKDSRGIYRKPHKYSPAMAEWDNDGAWAEPTTFTLLDVSRAYALWCYVRQTNHLAHCDIIEVGGWKGGISALMAKCSQHFGSSSTVYCCDTYHQKCGLVNATDKDVYKNGTKMNGYLPTSQDVHQACVCIGVAPVRILSGVFPEETGNEVQSRRFRLCHIDVDVYRSAKRSFGFLWDKVALGGVVVFDDYGFEDCPGETQFVEEEFDKPDRIITYNLNGHAVFVKTRV